MIALASFGNAKTGLVNESHPWSPHEMTHSTKTFLSMHHFLSTKQFLWDNVTTMRAAEDFNISNARFASECHEEWCRGVVVLVEQAFGAQSVEDVRGVCRHEWPKKLLPSLAWELFQKR